ncbi:MAG: iron-containing alcohol dehydrogenase [Pirellulales bacterium]|nr:iron-containing alcohol dehydrogenase [Pirellulales bacterium]
MEPPLDYDFLAPGRIVFGWGRRREVGALAAELGRRAWIVRGSRTLKRQGLIEEIGQTLRAARVEPIELETLSREPEVADVDRASAELIDRGAAPGDLLLAVGGGAAIDLAKAVAAMVTNRHGATVRDFLEGVGRGLALVEAPLPVLAMPTTAGAGAEATKNAVISSFDPPFKKSLRDPRLVPRIALVDPELTVSVPRAITAASGMDAITQLIESFISRKARPIPRALAVQGLAMALESLPEAVDRPESRPAREKMAHAALLSGVCLANAGLGLAHGVAAALGVHCRVPHGAACAVMLPVALRVNREACRAELALLARQTLRPCPTGSDDDAVEGLIARIARLAETIGAPRRLAELGVARERLPAIAADSRGSSMSGNPVDVSDDRLLAVLEAAL